MSPREMITNYHKHCQLKFGRYVQTHEEQGQGNSLSTRTVGAIALRPTGNFHEP